MCRTNDFNEFLQEFDRAMEYTASKDDVLDNCEVVILSGIGTEAQHDLCKEYTTDNT
jgi:hypothetical protein